MYGVCWSVLECVGEGHTWQFVGQLELRLHMRNEWHVLEGTHAPSTVL